MRVPQGARDVFRGAAEVRVVIVECVFFCGFWSIWEAGSVGGVFGDFEGEACEFPGFDNIIRFVWIGFVSGDAAQLGEWACNAGERLRVRLDRHCKLVGEEGVTSPPQEKQGYTPIWPFCPADCA